MSDASSGTADTVAWQRTTLGAISEYVTSGSRDWKQYYADRGALFIRTQDIASNRLVLDNVPFVSLPKKVEGKRSLVKRGDLLITITGNVGRVAVVDFAIPEAYISQSVCLVRLKDPSLAIFLRHQLLAKRGGKTVLEAKAYGLGRAVLNLENIRSADVLLAPQFTRERIVAEVEKQFSRFDEAIANLKRVKANLKRYKAAVLKAAVEGHLVPTEAELARREERGHEIGSQLLDHILEIRRAQWKGRGKCKEPVGVDMTKLPEAPENWTWAALDALSVDSGYGTSERCSYESNGPPVLRIPNVQDGTLDLRDVKFAPTGFVLLPASAVDVGDMLVIRTNGSRSLIGRAAFVLERPSALMTFASYLIRFRLVNVAELPAWVAVVWQEGRTRSWIESRAATSAGQHNISQSVLATAAIPLPPASEQRRILNEVARQVSVVNAVNTQVESLLQRAERARISLLEEFYAR